METYWYRPTQVHMENGHLNGERVLMLFIQHYEAYMAGKTHCFTRLGTTG